MIYIHIFIKFSFLILLYNISPLILELAKIEIIYISILTIIIVTLLLNSQSNFQRFIALSSISHLGFLILQFSYSYLFYIYIYKLTSLILLLLISSHHNNIIIKLFITLLLFSLSGLPPLPGFYTKLYILIDIFLAFGGSSGLNIYIIIIILISSIIITSNYIYLALISLDKIATGYTSRYTNGST